MSFICNSPEFPLQSSALTCLATACSISPAFHLYFTYISPAEFCPGVPGYCSLDLPGGLCTFECPIGPTIR